MVALVAAIPEVSLVTFVSTLVVVAVLVLSLASVGLPTASVATVTVITCWGRKDGVHP